MLIWYAGLRRHARRLIGRLSAGVGLARALDLTSPYRLAACNGGLELPAQTTLIAVAPYALRYWIAALFTSDILRPLAPAMAS